MAETRELHAMISVRPKTGRVCGRGEGCVVGCRGEAVVGEGRRGRSSGHLWGAGPGALERALEGGVDLLVVGV